MPQPISIVNVYYQGFGAKRLVGQLAMDGRRPVFGFLQAYHQTNYHFGDTLLNIVQYI